MNKTLLRITDLEYLRIVTDAQSPLGSSELRSGAIDALRISRDLTGQAAKDARAYARQLQRRARKTENRELDAQRRHPDDQ